MNEPIGLAKVYRQSREGMTLVEIMIAVAIIAVLAAMATSALAKARRSAQNSRLTTALRTISNAFDEYAIHVGRFPDDAEPGVIPAGMSDYLVRTGWVFPTPLGGKWDWAPSLAGYGNCIVMVGITATDERMEEIDKRMDDGDLATGAFRKIEDGKFVHIVEKE